MAREKCDEARPSCSQCRRGGRTCPGYARRVKFVDEGPKLRRSPRKNIPILSRTSIKSPDSRPSRSTAIEDLAPSGKHDADSPFGYDYFSRRRLNTELYHLKSPGVECDQILSSFVSTMFPLGATSVQSSFLGSWLWHVPSRLGCSVALDHAALSLALAYFARVSGDRLVLRNAELSYTLALKSLAISIADTDRQFGSEVLCATLCLGYYEVRALPAQRLCSCYSSPYHLDFC